MRTLTISLLVFCVVAVSSRPYDARKHSYKWMLIREWQNKKYDNDDKTENDIVPPEVEITSTHKDATNIQQSFPSEDLLRYPRAANEENKEIQETEDVVIIIIK